MPGKRERAMRRVLREQGAPTPKPRGCDMLLLVIVAIVVGFMLVVGWTAI